ncbi:MAG: hypothetical protein SWH61_10760 [Thermodesulfobacteriota bacterium]|nr:hypothetical protein [Thermodesulfobacteriota bacterium]
MKQIYSGLRVGTVNLVLLVVLLGLVECFSAIWVTRPPGNIVYHSRLNHTWKPDSSYLHTEFCDNNPEFAEPYRDYYNHQGWLERYDIQKEKPPAVYRIFYVGDSFTEGTCPMEQSVPEVVEKELNGYAKGLPFKFEVVNTGTSSYAPTLYYLLVRYVITDYNPDLIVVNVDMTDDFDDWWYGRNLIRDKEGNPQFAPRPEVDRADVKISANGELKVPVWSRVRLFFHKYSYTYNLIRHLRQWVFSPAIDGDDREGRTGTYSRWSWCKSYWDEMTRRNVDNSMDVLGRLIRWCQENNIKIMLTGVPHYPQYAGNPYGGGPPIWSSRPHAVLRDLAGAFQVPYLNSYERLKPVIQGTPQERFYYRKDMHFNPRGYAIWAEAQLDFLMAPANGLLPETFYRAVRKKRGKGQDGG